MTTKKKSKKERTHEISWTTTIDNLCPVQDKVLQQHADAIREWALTNDDAIRTKSYMYENRISPSVFYEWANRYAPLKQAIQEAGDVIGARREKKGLERKFDPGLVEKTMPMYDDDYKSWKLQMKTISDNNMHKNQVVVLERFPSTDKVPERKEEE